ncbi:MAG: hypothetical protein JSV88_29195 [Candidatus Aminicenantes bacterium]|nr:MAG: hypothetical protein JSV88_29195 [Candidatus Aminicenantes bacterium]
MRNKFIDIIKSNSLAMAKKWAKMVAASGYTRTYQKLPEEERTRLAKNVYDNLGRWLDPKTTQAEIGKTYADIGAKRYEQGYPLCELLYAFHYTKKVLLNHIFSESLLPDTLRLYQTYNFIQEIYDFFDLAVFYETRGFQEALYRKVLAQKGINKKNIEDIFPRGSFYYEQEPDFRSFEKALEGFNLSKMK